MLYYMYNWKMAENQPVYVCLYSYIIPMISLWLSWYYHPNPKIQ